MPSPIGHLLAGAAIAWLAPDAVRAQRSLNHARGLLALTAVAAALAALPDIDLLARTLHRSATHSLVSGIVVFIIAAAVTRWVIPAASPLSIGAVCCAAWLSHQLLDWMGTDTNPPRGIQWLWPFSDRWFISGWDLFPPTERRDPWSSPTMMKNAKAAAFEAAAMGAVAAAAWWARGRRVRLKPDATS